MIDCFKKNYNKQNEECKRCRIKSSCKREHKNYTNEKIIEETENIFKQQKKDKLLIDKFREITKNLIIIDSKITKKIIARRLKTYKVSIELIELWLKKYFPKLKCR